MFTIWITETILIFNQRPVTDRPDSYLKTPQTRSETRTSDSHTSTAKTRTVTRTSIGYTKSPRDQYSYKFHKWSSNTFRNKTIYLVRVTFVYYILIIVLQ